MVFALMVCSFLANGAQADTMKSLVRISCVPKIGLLDVEFRDLHDSVATAPTGQGDRQPLLAQAGFQDPHRLKFSCDLDGITYLITAEQDSPTNKICGASPEVYLTVTRAGEKLVSKAVFGASCNGSPSVNRITIGDGPKSWRGRETQVCYSSGKLGSAGVCDWTFGTPAQFANRFPVDQDRLQQLANEQEHR